VRKYARVPNRNGLVHDRTKASSAGLPVNLVIPDLSVFGNLERWRKIEMAKRRVIYTILRLGLPVEADGNVPAFGS
jgi:hypothetical protein